MDEPDAADELFAELTPSVSNANVPTDQKPNEEFETSVSNEVAEVKTNGEQKSSRKVLARALGIEITVGSEVEVSEKQQLLINKLLSDVAQLLQCGDEDQSNKSETWYISSRGDDETNDAGGKKPIFTSAFNDSVSQSTSFSNVAQEQPVRPERQMSCFNCEGPHNMNECPEPRDKNRISRNRSLYQQKNSGTPNGRYHREKEARFSRYAPGEISPALQEALGLRPDEVPPWIYEMRVLGYPPGYFRTLCQPPAKLVIYNEQNTGKESEDELNISSFVEYRGFNVPLPPGVHDEYYKLGYPPMLHQHLKENFLAHVTSVTGKRIAADSTQQSATAAERRKPSTEMDIDDDGEGRPTEPTPETVLNSSGSSTMEALEAQRQKILAELAEEEPPSKKQRTESNSNDRSAPASPEAIVDIADDNQDSVSMPKRIPLGDTSGEDIANSSQPSLEVVVCRSLSVDRGTPVHDAFRKGSKPHLEQFASGITPFAPHEESPVKPGCGGYKFLKKILKRKK